MPDNLLQLGGDGILLVSRFGHRLLRRIRDDGVQVAVLGWGRDGDVVDGNVFRGWRCLPIPGRRLDAFVSSRITIDRVEGAFTKMHEGKVLRSVVEIG